VHELVGFKRRASVAAFVPSLTGDEDLRREVDVRPSCSASDLDTVRKRRRGGVRPARAAVLREMLVAHVGEVVNTSNVSPVPVLRQAFLGDHFDVFTWPVVPSLLHQRSDVFRLHLCGSDSGNEH